LANQTILEQKHQGLRKTDQLLTTEPILNQGTNLHECKIICTADIIPLREKAFFRVIYETQLRPSEALNLQIENWDRHQRTLTAVRVKQKWDRRNKRYLPAHPRTALLTENTNEMIRALVGNRKKGPIFVNKDREVMHHSWFEKRINYYAKMLGIQKVKKYYLDGRTLKLVTLMALREAGERHHDNAGGSRKLSATASGHSMQVKQKHYEKVGDDFEQVHESYEKNHPAFVEGW
jgi:integrase